jgi:hypothetical protein
MVLLFFISLIMNVLIKYVVTMRMKVLAMATSLSLVLTLGALTTLHTPLASATSLITSRLTPDFFNIEGDNSGSGNGSGYIVCNPNCHLSTNSDNANSGSNGNSGSSSNSGSSDTGSSDTGSSDTGSNGEAAYRLTVNVPSHQFGASTVGMSITTANGYTDQTSVPTAGGSSYTFKVPKNQGQSVQVCVNSGTLSHDICRTYEATGNDMSVSLSALPNADNNGLSHRIHHYYFYPGGYGPYGGYYP